MASAGMNFAFMEMIRESGNGRAGGALSRPRPAQPVPALLSLSGRRRLAGIRRGSRWLVSLVGIARREVTEGRYRVFSAIPGNRAKNVARLASDCVGAFEKCEVATGRSA